MLLLKSSNSEECTPLHGKTQSTQLFDFNKCGKNRKKLGKRAKNLLLYEQGVQKLAAEFDCVTIINSIRELQAMVKLTMSDYQRMLNKFSQNSLLRINPSPDPNRVLSFELPFEPNPIVVPAESAGTQTVQLYKVRLTEFSQRLAKHGVSPRSLQLLQNFA
mmetsp:Transcript_28414/g.32509  ORF Transcript_28414/g.32509 Transcript_28414/m.32509 type:complete len:161 (-) Transcript_28414:18-500(-)